MEKYFIILALSILVTPSYSQGADEATLLNAMHSISSHDLLGYVKTMCDDKYEGRLTALGL
jgi:hypothetical protein